MMRVRIQSKTLLFFLLTLFIAQCGGTTAGIPSSTEGGVTGGQIYYEYGNPATGEEELTGGSGSDDYEDYSGSDGSTDGTGEDGSDSNVADDIVGISMPLPPAKCETPDDTTATALIKASTKTATTKTAVLGKTQGRSSFITVRGGPGTFGPAEEEREAIVANLTRREVVTTIIHKDGSFDKVEVKTEDKKDMIVILALDEGLEVAGQAMLFQTDAPPETCTMSDGAEANALLADIVLDTDPFRLQ